MNLPVPNVGQEPGPDWADDINNCMSLIDQHDHTNGNGVKITPSGLNINSTLSFGGNSASSLLSTNFLPQATNISTLDAVYDVLGDLWFNDGFGNQIRITQSGAIAGTPGSIANLVPPASATYVAGNLTFVWQSSANTSAIMDAGPIIIRNLTANSFGITLQAPTLSVDYTLTLPALPAQQSFMTLDAAGNMAAPWTVDNNTIKIIGNQLVAQPATVAQTYMSTAFKANGVYRVGTSVDESFFFPFNAIITAVWIYNGTPGTSGTTELDLLMATTSGGAFASILTTTGKITSVAASGVWTDSNGIVGVQGGVTKPVLSTTAVPAGAALRFDILQAMVGGIDCELIVQWQQT